MTFEQLGLSKPLLAALAAKNYTTPSPIQAQAIPHVLEGRDLLGIAQTGTGKTAAFALPILERLDVSQKSPQALVLAPTRELALQVCEAFGRYASHLRGVHVLPVYGGQGYGVQLSALRRGVHVIVGTPGRIMDHLDKGTLDLSELRFLVLDEADEMLKMGFAEDVETILADTPAEKHVALFSATMPSQIRRISKKYLTDALEITVERKATTTPNIAPWLNACSAFDGGFLTSPRSTATRPRVTGSSVSGKRILLIAMDAGMLITDAVTRFCAGTPMLMYAESTEPAIVEKPVACGVSGLRVTVCGARTGGHR